MASLANKVLLHRIPSTPVLLCTSTFHSYRSISSLPFRANRYRQPLHPYKEQKCSGTMIVPDHGTTDRPMNIQSRFLSGCSSWTVRSAAQVFSSNHITNMRFFCTDLPPHQTCEMPKLSPTMAQGTIAKWIKAEGDSFTPGDVLAQIETDKATVDFEAQDEGIIAKILVQEGVPDVTVGSPIAIIVDEQESVAAFKNYSAPSSTSPSPSTSASSLEAVAAPSQPPPPPPSSSTFAPAAPITPSSRAFVGNMVPATPLARVLALEKGISLSALKDMGSGAAGTILSGDLVKAQAQAQAQTHAPVQAQPQAGAPSQLSTAFVSADYTDLTPSKFKMITAHRLLESKQTIPHYYLTMECQIDKMLELRTEINSKARKGEYKLSLNDFVIKAAAAALRKVPDVNSQWMETVIRKFNNVDISIAVQTDIGLITPIVFNADRKGLIDISKNVKDLAAKAKDNKLKPEEFIGGTFTISNLGMFGLDQFCAVINPPQAAILAVGTSTTKVIPAGEGFKAAQFMTVTLSCDHRVVDGAVGAMWLQAFKQHVEDPISMLL